MRLIVFVAAQVLAASLVAGCGHSREPSVQKDPPGQFSITRTDSPTTTIRSECRETGVGTDRYDCILRVRGQKPLRCRNLTGAESDVLVARGRRCPH
jgi:hypothetical protein